MGLFEPIITKNKNLNKHFIELDSLRGLAAFTVLIHHYILIFPSIYDTNLCSNGFIYFLRFSPIHIIWAGHEAVIFFFVLSGFVLSLGFYKEEKVAYTKFIVRRVCRIYFPYIAAVGLAIYMDILFYRGGISQFSSWFNSIWSKPVSSQIIIQHVFLIGSFNNSNFDPVLWSLVHEIRVSIIFPLIIWIVKRYNWKYCIALGIALGILGTTFKVLCALKADYLDTLNYIGMFIVGALLAKYNLTVKYWFGKFKSNIKIFIITFAVLLYTNFWWLIMPGIVSTKIPEFNNLLSDWGVALGVSIFIMVSLSWRKVSSLLKNKLFHFLGNISYSLYLYHAICLITFSYILIGRLSILGILFLAFIMSLIVSTISYYLIELPSITIGHYLATKLRDS